MRFLLDTNAYTALMRGNASVVEAVRQAGQVLMSAVVVGELLYGFRHGELTAIMSGNLMTSCGTPTCVSLP